MTIDTARAPGAAHNHAIVIGASMAGLLAARVLADHFERVTVIERDHFPAEPVTRKGVPQARHVHVLLYKGKLLLEQFFPGLDAELAAAGAPNMDMIGEFPVLGLGGWNCRYPSPYVARTCGRPLLEWSVRRRLTAWGNVSFVEDTQATGLSADRGGARVTGVQLRARGRVDAPVESREADLVVDASGRGSRVPEWLKALGYDAPRETIINSFLGYASRIYEPSTSFHAPWKGLLLTAKAPDRPHGGVLFPLEQGRWIVTLTGVGRDYPPTDEEGFLDFARTLRSPILYEAIANARPLTPIYGYQRTENRLRHYERLPRWPERLVVIGDAVCAFNPVYGQGMTAAALGADTLDRHLRASKSRGLSDGFARGFQRDLARATAAPWLMATGEDFRWPRTEGGRPSPSTRLMHRYMDQILLLNARSSDANTTFTEVAHLLKPPTAFFKPALIAQILGRPFLAGRSYS